MKHRFLSSCVWRTMLVMVSLFMFGHAPWPAAASFRDARDDPLPPTLFLPLAVRSGTSAPPVTGAFFITPTADIDRPTSHPTVQVDAAGGVHVVFTSQAGAPQAAADGSTARPAYYAYCAANCATAAAFTIIPLGDGVDFASLALDPAGRPRVLLRLPLHSGAVFLFQYWSCDSNCATPGQWTSGSIGYTFARQVGWVEPFVRSFALDHLGRPRFVYYDAGETYDDSHRGVFYAYCDNACATAANWAEVHLLDDIHANDFALAFSPNGQPRLAYATYDPATIRQQVAYAECNQGCATAANWYAVTLADTASASVSSFAVFSLAVAANGAPRLALYTGTGAGGSLTPNSLYYLSCHAATCAQERAWSALNLNFPQTHGEEGLALALDRNDRPRLALHAPMAAGFGLYYAWCNANCAATAQSWQRKEVEPGERVNQELAIPPWPGCAFPQCNPPIPPCTVSTWDSGVRPSLALERSGNPRIAYDADHHQGGGCGAFIDTKLTRFALFDQP